MIYKGIDFPYEGTQQSAFKVWMNWDDEDGTPLYLSERFLLLVYHADVDYPLPVIVEYGIDLPKNDPRRMKVTYQVDGGGYVIIDLTDWVRTHYGTGCGCSCVVAGYDGQVLDGSQTLLEVHTQFYLINPNKIVMPIAATNGALILPPSRIIYGSYQPCAYTLFWKADAYSSILWRWRKFGTSSWTNLSTVEELTIDPDGIQIIGGGATIYTYIPEQEACKRCAYLIWKSFAGPEKMHAFDINSQKLESIDTYSLLTPDGSYSNVKGTEDSMRLSIDKLNIYDLWYYSDILTSSDVRLVIYDEEFVGSISSGRIVGGIPLEITTKSSTISSGDRSDGKLEFEAKIKRYDAVTL